MTAFRTMGVEEFRRLQIAPGVIASSKYNAKAVELNGIVYHSKAEMMFSMHLDFLKTLKRIKWYTRQVPFYLPGKPKAKRYLADFLVVDAYGQVHVLDVKGFDTDSSKIKRSVIQATHGIDIELIRVKRGAPYTWMMSRGTSHNPKGEL